MFEKLLDECNPATEASSKSQMDDKSRQRLGHLRAFAMFRFTIRDVLWLTAVVAVSVAWWTQVQRAERVEVERKLWETRTMQLKSQVERGSGASVKFFP